MSKSSEKKTSTVVKLAVLAVVVGSMLLAAYAFHPVAQSSIATPASTQAMPTGRAANNFADLIEQVKPAVVNISVSGKLINIGKWPGPQFDMPEQFKLPPGSRFEEFFRHFFDRPSDKWQGNEPMTKVQAVGSGFIVDPSGHVVTNNHVVNGAEKITVVLNDGTRYPAEIKGRDAKTDLALLKIEAKKPLPYVSFGDSESVRAGDWVVAIGNPFGLGGTATAGIVSARGRDIQSGPFDDYIQIDAPINRGSSGGPLFDNSGRVIGVNTAIFSPTGGNVGIGFAIPSSLAKSVVGQLRAHGKVERGWFGVKIQTVTDDVAKGLGMKQAKGALVASVMADSPAAKAGVQVGDVVVEYDGESITRMKDLPRLVANTEANKAVEIKVWRKGKEHSLNAVIGSTPGEEMVATADSGDEQADGKLGLSLAAATPELRQQYRLAKDTKGAVIVGVRPDSPAAEKGLRTGDVITMVGQKAVSTPDDVVKAVKKATANKREAVVLLVERHGEARFVALDLA
ncbi:MAG: DegQ family serine endoprotease [Acidiferrobacterales bacterium]